MKRRKGVLPVDQGVAVLCRGRRPGEGGVGEQGVVEEAARRGIGAEAVGVGREQRVGRADRERVRAGLRKGAGGFGERAEVAIGGGGAAAKGGNLHRRSPAVAGRRRDAPGWRDGEGDRGVAGFEAVVAGDGDRGDRAVCGNGDGGAHAVFEDQRRMAGRRGGGDRFAGIGSDEGDTVGARVERVEDRAEGVVGDRMPVAVGVLPLDLETGGGGVAGEVGHRVRALLWGRAEARRAQRRLCRWAGAPCVSRAAESMFSRGDAETQREEEGFAGRVSPSRLCVSA